MNTIATTNYANCPKSNWKCLTIDQVIESMHNGNKECLLEVIRGSDYTRMMFDIENVPDFPTMQRCINVVYEVIKLDRKQYPPLITLNMLSTSHSGLSCHLIIPIRIKFEDHKYIMRLIARDHSDVKNYFDDSIYTSIRLFRLPYQGKPIRGHNDNGEFNPDDHHKVMKPDASGIHDVYDTIDDCPYIKDAIVQNCIGLHLYTLDTIERIENNLKCSKRKSGDAYKKQNAKQPIIQVNSSSKALEISQTILNASLIILAFIAIFKLIKH